MPPVDGFSHPSTGDCVSSSPRSSRLARFRPYGSISADRANEPHPEEKDRRVRAESNAPEGNMGVPTVSVIVPAYGVREYARDAIGSILSQTLDDIEVIAIDDGSTDGTGDVLDEMAEGDPRLSVLPVENAGAPAARNRGLDIARGKYVYFADADDHVEPEMLERTVALAEGHGLELVVTGFEIDTYARDGVASLPVMSSRVTGSDEFGRFIPERKSCPRRVWLDRASFRLNAHVLFDENMLYTPWNKLFLRERIEAIGLRFDEGAFWDDFPFVLGYVRDVERVGVIPDVLYRFRRLRPESETSRWRDAYEKREEEHGWMLDLYSHWWLLGDESSNEMIHRRYIERVMGCVESVCDPASGMDKGERMRRIHKMTNTGRVENALRTANPKSLMMRAMLLPVRLRLTSVVEAEGRLMSLAKRHMPEGFALLKSAR